MSNDICIIHIPKTAGTSLKQIIKKKFKKSHDIYFDYGQGSEATSKLLLDTLYSGDVYNRRTFDNHIRQEKSVLIFGHYPAKKYLNFLINPNLHTFIRKPFDRFISEFIHHREVYGKVLNYSDSLIEDEFCNVIDKYFNGLSIEDFNSIGNANNFICDIKKLLKMEGKNLNFLDSLLYKYLLKKNVSSVKDKIGYILNLEPDLNMDNIIDLFERANTKDLHIYNQYEKSVFCDGTRGRT